MPTKPTNPGKLYRLSEHPVHAIIGTICAVLGVIFGGGSLLVAVKQLPPAPAPVAPPVGQSPAPPTSSVKPTPPTPTPPTPTPTPTPTPVPPPTPTSKLLTPGGGFPGEFIRRDEVYRDYLFRVGADLRPVTITVNADYGSHPVVTILDLHDKQKARYRPGSRDPIIKEVFPPKFPGEYVIRVQDKDGEELRFDISLDD